MPDKISLPNIDDLIQRYYAGVSINKLSQELGISRRTITYRFQEANVKLRSQSESEKVKWAQMDEQARKRQYQKAHEATRGRVVSTREKMLRAKSAYLNAFKKGGLEDELSDKLTEAGFVVNQQLAFGIYNLDIAIHGLPIAIEIQSNGLSKLRNSKNTQRAKYILSRGNLLLYVILDQSSAPICLDAIAQNIITYLNRLSGDKSLIGKYVMIGRDGKPFPSSRYNFDGCTRIE